MLYVLDEPSIGLHQRDNARLLETLDRLRDLGNSVIVVEHDEEAILTADHVVDMGPGAGIHGGEVVAEGTPEQVMANPQSLTGQYLTGFKQIPMPKARRKPTRGRRLTVVGARANNLKNITVGHSARPVHRGHRRVGRRQVDLPHRDALSRRGAQAHQRARASRRA